MYYAMLRVLRTLIHLVGKVQNVGLVKVGSKGG